MAQRERASLAWKRSGVQFPSAPPANNNDLGPCHLSRFSFLASKLLWAPICSIEKTISFIVQLPIFLGKFRCYASFLDLLPASLIAMKKTKNEVIHNSEKLVTATGVGARQCAETFSKQTINRHFEVKMSA